MHFIVVPDGSYLLSLSIDRRILDRVKSGDYSCQSLPEVLLCSEPNFLGVKHRLNLNTASFHKAFDGTFSSAIVFSGNWRFYDSPSYKGKSWWFAPGKYANLGAANNRISSVKLASRIQLDGSVDEVKPDIDDDIPLNNHTQRFPELLFYRDPGFTGRVDRVYYDLPQLGRGYNDALSSLVIINGIWRFYEHKNYGGKSWDLGPGYYPDVKRAGIPDNKVSSFKVVG